MNRRKVRIPAFLVIVVALIIVFFVRKRNSESANSGEDPLAQYRKGNILYSKHAQCRMECRNISDAEIKEVLQEGVINHRKSEPKLTNPRYALEDITQDGQKVRIVIALEKSQAILVTCIDLEKEWPCNCK